MTLLDGKRQTEREHARRGQVVILVTAESLLGVQSLSGSLGKKIFAGETDGSILHVDFAEERRRQTVRTIEVLEHNVIALCQPTVAGRVVRRVGRLVELRIDGGVDAVGSAVPL